MPSVEHTEVIELDQDLPFQERIWKLQRVAWVVMALILCAACLDYLALAR